MQLFLPVRNALQRFAFHRLEKGLGFKNLLKRRVGTRDLPARFPGRKVRRHFWQNGFFD
jgi:hypothetical protein